LRDFLQVIDYQNSDLINNNFMDNFERLFNEERKISDDFYPHDYSSHLNVDYALLLSIEANKKEKFRNYAGAIKDYKESLRVDAKDWYITYNQIAINYLMLEQFEKSRMAFDIAIELKEILHESGIDETDIPYTASGMVTKVSGERMYSNRAKVRLILGDYPGCLDDCHRAIEMNPYFANSYFIMGLLFMHLDELENAYQALDQADSLGHPQALLVLQQLISEIAVDHMTPMLVRED
jgi:tetratricopeptide (TPR) repeat protein